MMDANVFFSLHNKDKTGSVLGLKLGDIPKSFQRVDTLRYTLSRIYLFVCCRWFLFSIYIYILLK